MSTEPYTPTEAVNRYGKTMREVLMSYVVQSGECWIMDKVLTRNGYAQIMFNKKNLLAHRLSYELHVGPIPEGAVIDHLCRNRACVNPAHLDPVTIRENNIRGEGVTRVNTEKVSCPRGHPYSTENTYRHRGKRYCRECTRTRKLNRHRIEKEACDG